MKSAGATEPTANSAALAADGAEISLYEFNHYQDGVKEYLLAEGKAELNQIQKNPIAKWGCRINEKGIEVKNT